MKLAIEPDEVFKKCEKCGHPAHTLRNCNRCREENGPCVKKDDVGSDCFGEASDPGDAGDDYHGDQHDPDDIYDWSDSGHDLD